MTAIPGLHVQEVSEIPPLPETSVALPFPGSFRPNEILYWFPDTWEADRFVRSIQAEAANKIIHLVGHATELEHRSGHDTLGLGRARTVFFYLKNKGIDPNRMIISQGGPVDESKDLQSDGKPRRRYVEVLLLDEPLR